MDKRIPKGDVALKIGQNFCLQFESGGLTLSCGVGPTHYCGNRDEERAYTLSLPGGTTTTMEVALIAYGKFVELAMATSRCSSDCSRGRNCHHSVMPYLPIVRLSALLKVLQSEHSIDDRIDIIKHLLRETDYA